jgi:WD40 repeat protein
MTRWWLRTFAIAGFLAVSCGSANPASKFSATPSAVSTTSIPTNYPPSAVSTTSIPTNYPPPTTASSARTQQCPAVQPAPQFQPSAPSSRNLALLTLRGNSSIIVRDITDLSHPTTVSTLGTIQQPQFVSATVLSYVDHHDGVSQDYLVRAPLAGSPTIPVAASCQSIIAITWSPDGSTVVYVTQNESGADVHQLSSSGDRVLGSIPAGGIGGCEAISSCAVANTLDYRLSYSPDGTSISLVVNMFSLVVFRVWSADGRLLRSSDSQRATMSAWSGTGLYFRDPAGVEVFRDGADSTFLPGVAWIKPNASPGGGQIVYAARDSAGWGHVFVVDTTTRQVRELKTARSQPVFLTSRYIWYQGERDCVPADQCGSQPPFHLLSGKTYIYDLQDGTETESIITGVADVWPHAA